MSAAEDMAWRADIHDGLSRLEALTTHFMAMPPIHIIFGPAAAREEWAPKAPAKAPAARADDQEGTAWRANVDARLLHLEMIVSAVTGLPRRSRDDGGSAADGTAWRADVDACLSRLETDMEAFTGLRIGSFAAARTRRLAEAPAARADDREAA